MTDLPRIRINPGQASVSLDLRNTTALLNCVKVDSDFDGRLMFVRKWPDLSVGEEVLWAVLGWLNGVNHLPDWDMMLATLDADNVAAVDAILLSEGVR